jgi:hypothetical protein
LSQPDREIALARGAKQFGLLKQDVPRYYRRSL